MSFAATLFNPTAETDKDVQYFEMFGHRGLVHDGWKAVAYHQPGTPFDDDEWELYHLDRGGRVPIRHHQRACLVGDRQLLSSHRVLARGARTFQSTVRLCLFRRLG